MAKGRQRAEKSAAQTVHTLSGTAGGETRRLGQKFIPGSQNLQLWKGTAPLSGRGVSHS